MHPNLEILQFLIDTGAEINLIQLKNLKPRCIVATHEAMTLTGITQDSVVTIGSTEITFFDKPVKFQVINQNLPLPVTGILGVDFLKAESAQISFHHNSLITSSRPIEPIRFFNYEYRKPKSTGFILKARSKTPITVNLINTNLKTGYLKRLETPEKIFIGNAVVTNNNQKCCVMAINSYDEDARIEIPPQELEDFNEVDESEDFFHSDDSEGEPVPPEQRLDKIIQSLRLDHLNEEEKTTSSI